MKALIVKEDGLIYVDEVPEEPEYCTLAIQDQCENKDVWVESLIRFTCACRSKEVNYEKALASAIENAVLCADQEHATGLLSQHHFFNAYTPDRFRIPGVYPIPDLKWEVKEQQCKDSGTDELGRKVDFETVAILTLSEQPKPHRFCVTPNSNCSMNYCDDNGCQDRRRELVEQPKGEESQEDAKPIRCPFCDSKNTLTMKQVTETKIKGSRVIKGIFDVWECSQCGEGFTKHWQIIPIDTDNA